MTGKLRAGIIGCGNMARSHTFGYLNCGKFKVVGLSDLSKVAMEEYDRNFSDYEDYHPTHYTDANEMLDSENLDVVSIGTWHKGHAIWTLAAAARKPKAILCEKPMAENPGRADEMRVACRRNRVKLVIGHEWRFMPSYEMARQLIASGAIGDVQLITAISGSGLPNDASHLMDMFRYLLLDDECEWVMGNIERYTDRHERGTRIEDRAVGVLGFKNGARAMVLSELTDSYHQGGIVYGSDGIIELLSTSLRLMNKDTAGKWEHHSPSGKFFNSDSIDNFVTAEGNTAQADELADWINGNIEIHRGEATNGYKAIEMAYAIYESARLHERVSIPLRTRSNPLELMIDSGHLPVRYPGIYDIRWRQLRGENMGIDTDNV